MISWRSAWRAIRAAAAKGDAEKGILPRESLARLRFHDLRHHAITELAETAASDSVIRSIAGHVSQKMLEHYSHVRLEAKRRALEAIATKWPQDQSQWDSEGVTLHGTLQKASQRECQHRKFFKKLAGTTGLEPAASCVTVPGMGIANIRSSRVLPCIYEPFTHVKLLTRNAC